VAEPVVDAHHHIWRQADLPWLEGPTVPRIFGDYEPIKRDYPIEEFLQDVGGSGVVRSIYVQTNWPRGRAVDEVAWVQAEADRTGWPHAAVGFVDLLDEGAPEVLAAQARYPLMRGIRQQIHWHENPLYRFAGRPDTADDPVFRRNLARLAERNWIFELQVFASQMESAARLAADLPDITFVLDHAGMLEDRSREAVQAWRDGMRRLAERPNMTTKLSALGTFVRRNDPQHIADVVGQTLDIFGAERCMWGSNFPIEKLWTDYESVLGAVRRSLSGLSDKDRRRVLADNAVQVYGLPPLES
jgi:predicted TIM-barrel fold metal-dependent hydrolase